MREGVLLINLGTPDSPSVRDVRKYLREFLMDERVLDMPFLKRFFLVNCVIAPFRAPQSSKIYKELWQEGGSPLLAYGLKVKEKLQDLLGENYFVAFGMRYQKPSLKSALDELKLANVGKIKVIPLYPQYASASTGSSIQKLMRLFDDWPVIPDLEIMTQFCTNLDFIKAFAQKGSLCMDKEKYDHFVFSYHGLPESQILQASRNNYCQLKEKCCAHYGKHNQFCYRAQCFETTRLLAQELSIAREDYTVSFQSRLGRNPWIKPYTDGILKDLPGKGKKKVLAFSPAFVCDCLETTIEVGVEYKDLFIAAGGQQWDLVESLNDSDLWVECLTRLVQNVS